MESCYTDDLCFDFPEFHKLHNQFLKIAEAKGFPASQWHDYPHRVYNSCTADSLNSYVINADGSLYSCWEDIGDLQKRIGIIGKENEFSYTSRYLEFMTYDPTMNPKCSQCSVLPICMSGCPIKRMRRVFSCTEYKWNLEEKLKAKTVELIAQRIQSSDAV